MTHTFEHEAASKQPAQRVLGHRSVYVLPLVLRDGEGVIGGRSVVRVKRIVATWIVGRRVIVGGRHARIRPAKGTLGKARSKNGVVECGARRVA